jgi:FlaA1/EpsC-like NDP-sugar epimerase
MKQMRGDAGKRFASMVISSRTRFVLLFLFDLACSVASLYAAILLRFGFTFPVEMRRIFLNWAVLLFLLQFLTLLAFRLYNITLRFVSIMEMYRLLKAFAVCTAMAVAVDLFFARTGDRALSISVGVLLIDGLLAFCLFGMVRLLRRLHLEILHRSHPKGKPTLIIGANLKSERLLKELRLSRSRLEPVLIADMERRGMGGTIHDLPVVDYDEEITRQIKSSHIEAALINMPTASHREVSEVFNRLKKAGVDDIRIVPRMDEWKTSVHQIRRVDIEDLLARQAVRIESRAVAAEFASRTVLVTGAAGSIGSEIVRKLYSLGIRRLVAFDSDESGTFQLQQELLPFLHPEQEFAFVVGSVRDPEKLRQVYRRYQPQLVFHAAAYKHVPLMEEFPEEALRTNVLGTLSVAQMAIEHQVQKFVNISTDKAVKPCSAMGASKRLAEMACQALNGNGTHFLSVRFGNVLGSRGSVVPLFQEQIRRGGPVTLTHPDMRRYFMSIPEAVLLVFQAAYQGQGGEVFVLDMGDPVRIRDLAENLIRLNGFEPGRDIEIVATGMRPGEKLFEELLTAEEGVDATSHDKIYVARFKEPLPHGFVGRLASDCQGAGRDREKIRALFTAHIPSFCSQ